MRSTKQPKNDSFHSKGYLRMGQVTQNFILDFSSRRSETGIWISGAECEEQADTIYWKYSSSLKFLFYSMSQSPFKFPFHYNFNLLPKNEWKNAIFCTFVNSTTLYNKIALQSHSIMTPKKSKNIFGIHLGKYYIWSKNVYTQN